jgi:peptide deformylase
MAELEIRTYPDPILREKCRPVENIDESIRALAADMAETAAAAPGVGLAAPQVGETLRLVVIDLSMGEDPDQLHVLVNPEIESTGDEEIEAEEGCLSLPEIFENVTRPARVRVRARNLEGREFILDVDGRLARVLHHEIEHLDGKLLLDRLNRMKRGLIKRHLKKRAKAASAS